MAFLDAVTHSLLYEQLFFWDKFNVQSTEEELYGLREPSSGFRQRFPRANSTVPFLPWTLLTQTPDWVASTLHHTQNQSSGSLLLLDSVFASLLLVQINTAILATLETEL